MTAPEESLPATFARVAAMPPDTVLAIFRRYGRPLGVGVAPPPPDHQRGVGSFAGETPPAPGRVRQGLG